MLASHSDRGSVMVGKRDKNNNLGDRMLGLIKHALQLCVLCLCEV